jgi:Bacterial extracellular solute-binding protein
MGRMRRRTFIRTATAAPLLISPAVCPAHAVTSDKVGSGTTVVWKPLFRGPADFPVLDGHTDTVPDIVGRLGSPIALAIFTEGNHFPALLGGEIIEPFRAWARAQTQHAGLALDNILVVTLPQPMIVGILLGGGISLGNLTVDVSRTSGIYPDIVMGGEMPLTRLRKTSIVEAEARIFARNRGLSLLVAAGNPLGVRSLGDVARPGIRIVMASENEPGARRFYISALDSLIGQDATRSILAGETVTFLGRLGIQHRDVLQAIAGRNADVGIIVHHLARYFAAAYPQYCAMVTVPGAEQLSSTMAMAATVNPLRRHAAKAFTEFFLGAAREVYPRYGFATMNETEYGATIRLE